MSQPRGIVVRKVVESDFDRLWMMLKDCRPQQTRLTRSGFHGDLFGKNDLEGRIEDCDDPSIEFDVSQAKLGSQVCQALVAELGDELVGYLIFHYFFTPWKGHLAFLDDVYVRPGYRGEGIATGLIQELKLLCKRENLVHIVYSVSGIEPMLTVKLLEHGAIVFRDDSTDWSVFRVEFK